MSGIGRARFLKGLGAAVAFGFADISSRSQAHSLASGKPNVIIVVTDDQPVHTVETMGAARERVFEVGASFGNAFAPTPVCAVARASILRGQYAHNHRIIKNKNSAYHYRRAGLVRDDLSTRMRAAGYLTGFFGKYLNNYQAVGGWEPPGWDRWYGLLSPLDESGPHRFNVDGKEKQVSGLLTDVLADKLAGFATNAAAAGVPFFAMLCPTAPHGPMQPAPRHEHAFDDVPLPWVPSFNEADVSDKPGWARESLLTTKEKRRMRDTYEAILEELRSVDDAVVVMDRALEAAGIKENTFVFYVSDNGYLLGEHRMFGKSRVYDESVKVPLAVRGPGVIPGPRDALVANVDIAPTVLDLAGAAPMPYADGRSFAALLRGEPYEVRDAVLLEWLSAPDHFSPSRWHGVRTADRLYVEHPGGGRELYDLAEDPHQLESLHADPARAEEEAALSARLQALKACSGDSCRAAENL